MIMLLLIGIGRGKNNKGKTSVEQDFIETERLLGLAFFYSTQAFTF